MNRMSVIKIFSMIVIAIFSFESKALLISGQDIIAAPAFVIDDAPGATNTHQQAFNEVQSYLLTSDLNVDSGTIAAGTMVDSHMIFLNTIGTAFVSDIRVDWGFDGDILGVMSDYAGNLEAASSSFLGAAGTVYPSSFSARGMEGNDAYLVTGSSINVSMYVTEPGDWIRVITRSSVPEPSSLLLLGVGLLGLSLRKRVKAK